jgi:ankyrin repeat protein
MNELKKLFSFVQYNKLDQFYNILDAINIDEIDEYKRTVLHIASANPDVKFLSTLLAKGFNPNMQDDQGNTPLHYAASESLTENIELLIRSGAKADIQNIYGNTPLWDAVYSSKGKIDTLQKLLENGAKPTMKNKVGKSPLDFAYEIGFPQAISLLEKYA